MEAVLAVIAVFIILDNTQFMKKVTDKMDLF